MTSIRYAYADAPALRRALVAARPLICPPEPLLEAVPPNSAVLDVGCGAGALFISLALRGDLASGTGCDIDPKAIAVAIRASERVNHHALRFVVATSVSEIPSGPFDVVTLVDVIHHMPPDAQRDFFLACAKRVRAGGRLVYKDMAARPLWKNLFNRLHDAVIARQHIHYAPLTSVERWAVDAGLSIPQRGAYSRGPYAHELLVLGKASR